MQHILHTYIRSLVQAVMACHCQVASVMSDSVRPHGLQPTRLLCPRDSPGKDTGVGCHFLLQCMKVESESEVAQSCLTLSDPMDCSPLGSSIHGIFQARVLEWGTIAFSQSGLSLIHKNVISLRNYISLLLTLPNFLMLFFHQCVIHSEQNTPMLQ